MKVLAYRGEESARKYWPDAEFVTDNPPEPGAYDGIYFEHVIQQLPRKDVSPALTLLYECLKPGGKIIVMAPDLQWACREIANKPSPALAAYAALYGPDDERHQSGFTLNWLRKLCESTGFVTETAYAMGNMTEIDGETQKSQSIIYIGVKPIHNPSEAIE